MKFSRRLMSSFKSFRSAICAAAFVMGAAHAGVVNFDDLSAGALITTQYSSQGVYFVDNNNQGAGRFFADQSLPSFFPSASVPNVAFFDSVVDPQRGGDDALIRFSAPTTGFAFDFFSTVDSIVQVDIWGGVHIVSSQIAIIGNAQIDGRRYVTESHIDSLGNEHRPEYLAAVGTDYEAVMLRRAAQLNMTIGTFRRSISRNLQSIQGGFAGSIGYQGDTSVIQILGLQHYQPWPDRGDFAIDNLVFGADCPSGNCGRGAGIPEPGTLALLALGLVGLGYSRRK